jgi:hypothetical protein
VLDHFESVWNATINVIKKSEYNESVKKKMCSSADECQLFFLMKIKGVSVIIKGLCSEKSSHPLN